MPPDPTSKTIPVDDGSGAKADKTAEALSGGFGGLGSVAGVLALPRHNGEEARRYGDRIWDCVDKDQAAGGSLDLLCYAALANDLEVVPSVQLEPGKRPETPEQQAELDLSAEVAGWVRRTMTGLETPFASVARTQMRGALKDGADVADLRWAVVSTAEDGAQLVLKAVKPKERRAWLFEVDRFFNLLFVRGAGGDGPGWVRWPREKFMVLTWGGRGGDPRGESIFVRAVEPWNFRAQLPDDHFRFLKRFGTPKVLGKAGQSTRSYKPPGGVVSGVQDFLNKLLGWNQGQVAAVNADDAVEVHEVKSEGAAFVTAMNFYGLEIVKAVLLAGRATVEAKSGSKADSETAENILGHLVRFLRGWVCDGYKKDVFYKVVAYRYGAEVARRHTPGASLGEVEHHDVAALLAALAAAGYSFDPSQLPAVDKHLGFVPVRDAGPAADPKGEGGPGGPPVRTGEGDPASGSGTGPSKEANAE